MKAIELIDKPLWFEARAYCDRYDRNSYDEVELVRLSMCYREFQRLMRPHWDCLARFGAFSILGEEPTSAYVEAERLINDLAIVTAQRLGVHMSPAAGLPSAAIRLSTMRQLHRE